MWKLAARVAKNYRRSGSDSGRLYGGGGVAVEMVEIAVRKRGRRQVSVGALEGELCAVYGVVGGGDGRWVWVIRLSVG